MPKPQLLLIPRRKTAPTLESADRFLLIMVALWVCACWIAIAWFFLNP